MLDVQENGQTDCDPKDLLLEKHVNYVANHGNDKNDFVSILYIFY